MTAVTLLPGPAACEAGAGKTVVTTLVVLLFSYRFRATNGFVGWEPHSGRKQSCFFLPPLVRTPFEVGFAGWCVV